MLKKLRPWGAAPVWQLYEGGRRGAGGLALCFKCLVIAGNGEQETGKRYF